MFSNTSYFHSEKPQISPFLDTHKHMNADTHRGTCSHTTVKPHAARSISSHEMLPAVMPRPPDTLSVYPTSHKSNLSLLVCYSGTRGFLSLTWNTLFSGNHHYFFLPGKRKKNYVFHTRLMHYSSKAWSQWDFNFFFENSLACPPRLHLSDQKVKTLWNIITVTL